jgi:hypothetical protein
MHLVDNLSQIHQFSKELKTYFFASNSDRREYLRYIHTHNRVEKMYYNIFLAFTTSLIWFGG